MIIILAQAFPPRPGGIQNLLAGTAHYIAEAGYDVTVLADGGRAERAFDLEANASYKIERFSGPRPLRRYLKNNRMMRLVKAGNVKALYADTWKSLEAIRSTFEFPIVTWAHGNEFPKSSHKNDRIRAALSKADHIVFNSEDTMARARDVTPSQVRKTIVYPPIVESEIATEFDDARVSEIWGEREPKLFSMCRLIDWKGIDQAIRSMPDILEKFPNAKYVIAGVGEDLAHLKSLVADLRIDNSVEFIGWVEGGLKTSFLKSADLFLQPGRQIVEEREGYGITYVEAAYHGLPTISGNVGGAPEANIDGKTGLVVDATNSKNVSAAILSLLMDPERMQQMRLDAREHGQQNLWQNKITNVLACANLA